MNINELILTALALGITLLYLTLGGWLLERLTGVPEADDCIEPESNNERMRQAVRDFEVRKSI